MSPAMELHDVKKQKKPNKKRKNRPIPQVDADATGAEGGGLAVVEEDHHEEENEEKSPEGSGEEQEVVKEDMDGDQVGDGTEMTAPAAKKKKKEYGILTSESFSRLPISELTMKAIQEMGFENMTQVTSRFIVRIFQI
ncbi:hypothetical protein BHE74_00008063 [Ensete ventricosum]|uniref:Uncharacterized protein n=1 Tax=Ensete ventricosum TaxID=4639 RepID=A0A444G486_ENSVE|nr:hypothetical protein B296_00028103 [Ensete ventricosum]RWW29700.1 hypothetical protein GW17_00005764 [Ensete ventricosum]RWW83413.1 hypothetical protein BHE74_00008063 [Ensete ventricosum]RZR86824.1 hypothetical protein BHM03_00014100 [Ensete ventricosum]